jgi:hypothetical protein
MKLVQENDSKVVCTDGGSVLLEYVYRPEVPVRESAKPYFHPIRTLAGTVVTAFRPDDHLHHHGLCMTLSQVDDHNFWGGSTYRRETGTYQELHNYGKQEHAGWDILEASDEQAVMKETVRWLTIDEEHLLTDTRQFTVSQVNRQEGSYVLDVDFRITNVSGRSLTLGNFQSIGGLKGSFYTGFAFRAADRFAEITDEFEPRLMAAGGLDGVDVIHGASAPWMAMAGRDPATGAKSTVILMDQSGNPGYPNKWFVRWGYTQAAFPMIADQPMVIPPQKELRLVYRILIADGVWSRAFVEEKIRLIQM